MIDRAWWETTARSLLTLVVSLPLAVTAAKAKTTVELRSIEFRPDRIKVEPGEPVRFVNKDPFEHDVYIVNAADAGDVLVPATDIASGESLTVTLERKGVFDLYCTIHGGMTGKVTTTGSFELTEAQKRKAKRRQGMPPLAKKGKALFWGEGQCHQCHRMGDRGDALRGPDLANIGLRAKGRADDLGLDSGTAYIVQSVVEPSAHVVSGYTDDMPRVYQPPIGLTAKQLEAVVAYLQSRGGEADPWVIDISGEDLPRPPEYNPFHLGDAAKGKKVFQTHACGNCHEVGDGSPTPGVGPDLTEIGRYRHWTWLAEAVLEPAAEVGANWRTASIRLRGGKQLSGALHRRTSEKVVFSVPGQGRRALPAEKVEQVQVVETSMMPATAKGLSFKQVADLVQYLRTLTGKQESPGEEEGRSSP